MIFAVHWFDGIQNVDLSVLPPTYHLSEYRERSTLKNEMGKQCKRPHKTEKIR